MSKTVFGLGNPDEGSNAIMQAVPVQAMMSNGIQKIDAQSPERPRSGFIYIVNRAWTTRINSWYRAIRDDWRFLNIMSKTETNYQAIKAGHQINVYRKTAVTILQKSRVTLFNNGVRSWNKDRQVKTPECTETT